MRPSGPSTPTRGSEAAFRLLARSHLAVEDVAGPRAALERCRAALAELAVDRRSATDELLGSVVARELGT